MVGGVRGADGGVRGVRMVGHPPLVQSTFDNMGAEASALRESLVISLQKLSEKGNMASFYLFRGWRRR